MSMHWYTYIGPYVKLSQKLLLEMHSQYNAEQGDQIDFVEEFFGDAFFCGENTPKGIYIPNNKVKGSYENNDYGEGENFIDLYNQYEIFASVDAFKEQYKEMFDAFRTIDPTGVEAGYGFISYFK
jgi:hypothetical protein